VIIIQKLGCKTKIILFEMEREIKSDTFVIPFTELVRFFEFYFGN
jgi:hypothetical protein